MLRINLLPAYVAQRRLTKQMVVLFILIFSGITVVFFGWYGSIAGKDKEWADKADAAERDKANIDKLTAEATSLQGKIPDLQTKVKFVQDVQDYNRAYVDVYRSIAMYTTPDILYSSMTISGTSLSISAYAPNLPALARYLQVMYNQPKLKSVSVSAIPGFHSDFEPTKADFTLPQLPPGYVAHFPGSNQPVKSFTVAGGQIVHISSGEEKTQTTQADEKKVKILYNPSMGFDFTVAGTLTSFPTAPTPPAIGGGGGGAAPAAGGPGGPGGMPGGPGMPPGGPPGGRPK